MRVSIKINLKNKQNESTLASDDTSYNRISFTEVKKCTCIVTFARKTTKNRKKRKRNTNICIITSVQQYKCVKVRAELERCSTKVKIKN